jgi:sporulation protein YlmC with PRC-barrel domain
MELKEGTSVYTPGGEELGRVSRFVLDPSTNEVTHLVIQKGWLLPEDKVIPFELVSAADEDRVRLNEEIADIDELPSFEETHYIETDRPGAVPDPATVPGYRYAPAYYWYPPYGFAGHPVGYYGWPPTETIRNIPPDTVPLKEGSNVMSSDGKHVGDVERLFVDPASNKATHFLVSQGLLFKEHKLVPAHWVRDAEDGEVHLSVSSELLERLPDYQE